MPRDRGQEYTRLNPLKIESLVLGPLQTNCYIIWDEESREAAVVDVAADPEAMQSVLETLHLRLKMILLTHGHFDHIAGVDRLNPKACVEVGIHPKDRPLCLDPERNLSLYMGLEVLCSGPFFDLNEGARLALGVHALSCIETPGHSPGSVSFTGDGFAIVGDTLFQGSIGRTDLPGAAFSTLLQSITLRLLSLDERTRVLPGHGPETTIGKEKNENPFLAEARSFF